MKIRKCIENMAPGFREDSDIAFLYPCDICGGVGYIEVIGDINCRECGNTITLCKACLSKFKESIMKV